jgi:hypothetical protein
VEPASLGADVGGTHGMGTGCGTRRRHRTHTLKRNGVAACSGNTLPWKRLVVGR